MASPNLDTTIGALLIGGLVSAILYGITSTQSAVYYQRGHRDSRLTRLVVFVLWLLDSLDMCLIFHILYWYLVRNYGNVFSLAMPVWSIVMHVMVTVVTQTIVRGMFALRVWRLSQGKCIAVIAICILSFVDLVVNIVITVAAFHSSFVTLKKLDPLVYLEFVSGFSGDALVACYLCYLLHKSRTSFEKTNSMINILIAYFINTGLFTAVTSGVSVILFITQANNFIYVAVYFQLSKLYVNAYLGMLNARDAIRSRSDGDVVSVHLSQLSNSSGHSATITSSNGLTAAHPSNKSSMPISVQVDTQVHHR